MNKDLPEYFVALVKQFANLSSYEQSQRAIHNVSHSLNSCLNYDSRVLFFKSVPNYLTVNNKMFFSQLKSKNDKYNHSILVDRLKIAQNLTDEAEVNNILKAYLDAVLVVVGDKNTNRVIGVLPDELKNNIYQ